METRGQSLRGRLGCFLAPTPTVAFRLIALHLESTGLERAQQGKAQPEIKVRLRAFTSRMNQANANRT